MKLAVWIQYLLPQRLLSIVIYHATRCTWPALKNPLIKWFYKHYRINLDEAEENDPTKYESFNAFFTRRLKSTARPMAGDENTVISPVDGYLTQFGVAKNGALIQAKGISYSAEELLGETTGLAQLTQISYATLYLSPSQYHRVHLPLSGTVTRTRYIPGKRFSVNEVTASSIQGLYCHNERVITWFETNAGEMALVLVGALNVSSISIRWLGEIISGKPKIWDENKNQLQRYERGEEIGRFNLGSTVILIMPPEKLIWHSDLEQGQKINVAEKIGTVVSSPTQV